MKSASAVMPGDRESKGCSPGSTRYNGTCTGLGELSDQGAPFPFYLGGDLGVNGDFFNRLDDPSFDNYETDDLLEHPPKDYLEQIAKTLGNSISSPDETKLNGYFEKRYLEPPCGEFLAVGECSGGHRFGKEIYCGREWCKSCRHYSQMRRIARWLPKAQQMAQIGYFVITFPLEIRILLRDKRALALMGRRASRILRSLGYSRGLRRWHFFGDKSQVYNPHLNIIVEGAYLPKTKPGEKPKRGDLEYTIAYLRRKLIPVAIRSQLGHEQDIHYSYHHEPGRIYHRLRYICRATFLDYDWDRSLALALRGFRNTACWGKWDSPSAWSIETATGEPFQMIVDLVASICPHCKKPLHWHIPKGDHQYFAWSRAVQLSFGYWELYRWRAPPGRYAAKNLSVFAA